MAKALEERDWPGETQADRVHGARRYDVMIVARHPFIFGHDQRFEPNRDAGFTRTWRSLAQFPGTEREDRKPVRLQAEMGLTKWAEFAVFRGLNR